MARRLLYVRLGRCHLRLTRSWWWQRWETTLFRWHHVGFVCIAVEK